MPSSGWRASYHNHQIRVTNAWLGGAKLFVDGECRDTNSKFIVSPLRPALSARIAPLDGEPFVVEVFMEALFTVKANICVNGSHIGGDFF